MITKFLYQNNIQFFVKHTTFLRKIDEHLAELYTEWKTQLKRKGAIKLYEVPLSKAEIYGSDKIIWDGQTTSCVLLLLYDEKNKKAMLLHFSEMFSAEKTIPKKIDEMVSQGSEKIIALIAGGPSPYMEQTAGFKSSLIWNKSYQSLTAEKYRDIVELRQYEPLNGLDVDILAFEIATGKIRYLGHHIEVRRFCTKTEEKIEIIKGDFNIEDAQPGASRCRKFLHLYK